MPRISSDIISKPFRNEVSSTVKSFKDKYDITPRLVGFLANDDVGAKKYAEWTQKACIEDGITFEIRNCKPAELEDEIKSANEDSKIHGILIYYPCFGGKPSFFGGKMDDYLRDLVRAEKDVEGLCFTYRFNLYHNIRFIKHMDGRLSTKKCLLPCTPLAIIKILEYLGAYIDSKLESKTITIINRSDIVGRPLSAMLSNDGACVYSVDIDSIFMVKNQKMNEVPTDFSVDDALKLSDIVVTGVPSKDFKLNVDALKPDSIVINVSSFQNVNRKAIAEKKGIKFVPLVGKVTVAMLERNLLRLIQNYHLPNHECSLIESGGRLSSKSIQNSA